MTFVSLEPTGPRSWDARSGRRRKLLASITMRQGKCFLAAAPNRHIKRDELDIIAVLMSRLEHEHADSLKAAA